MAENKSDSNAELVTFTGQSDPAVRAAVQIISIPMPPLTVEPGQPARKPKAVNKPKARTLTEAQKRTRKIRVWMLSQSSRPNLETYWRAMDDAKIAPPPVCLRAGKRTFEKSLEVKSLAAAIRAELSRLWRTSSPQ